jgi:hypothetical protein
MSKLAAILDAARSLSRDERQRLIIELDALGGQENPKLEPGAEPLAAIRALSGTAHSDFTDISTNKYAHVAAASLDPKG